MADRVDFKKLYQDKFLAWASKAYIESKNGGDYIRFQPNAIQKKHIVEDWDLRLIILKPRQIGFTTLKILELLFFCSEVPNFRAGLMLQDDKAASRKMEGVMDVIKNIGPDLKLEIDEKQCSSQRIRFKNTGATIVTGSGASDSPLRSYTIQYLLADEIAFWARADEALGSIKPAVHEGNILCIQSTPSDRNTRFYQMYDDAKTSTYVGALSLKPLFYSWKDMPDYTYDPPKTWMPTDDDINVMAKHGLSIKQAYWRRVMLGSDKPTMSQRVEFTRNYPLSDVDCWDEASTTCPFVIEDLNKLTTRKPDQEIDEVRIYETPNLTKRYSIGVDTSYGVKKDDNALVVLDKDKNVCATFSSNAIPARKFAYVIKKVGEMYNMADVCIEINASGYFVAEILTEIGYPLRKIDKQVTTQTSRNNLVTLIDKFISSSVRINDEQLKQQLLKFSRNTEDMKNIKDDLGMAFGWALYSVNEGTGYAISFTHLTPRDRIMPRGIYG